MKTIGTIEARTTSNIFVHLGEKAFKFQRLHRILCVVGGSELFRIRVPVRVLYWGPVAQEKPGLVLRPRHKRPVDLGLGLLKPLV